LVALAVAPLRCLLVVLEEVITELVVVLAVLAVMDKA
jgi:hypothetical protein